jgi:glycosyltransferase involved in cell wall biosynthesis
LGGYQFECLVGGAQFKLNFLDKVSIIMTVYNGERFLREAIESCVNQTYANLELIIIDDGSTDSSLAIINYFEDHRIVLLINESNKGQSYSRNRGIKESTGEYIAIMDADDIMYPNRLEKQIQFLQSGNNEICFSWADIIDETGEWVKLKKHISDSLLIHAKLIFECPLIHPTAMWNKDAFISNNLWYDETYVFAQDMELWNRVKEYYPIAIMEEPLIRFRFGNSNSVSFQKKELQNSFALSITQRELLKLGLKQNDVINKNNVFIRINTTVKIFRCLTKKMGKTNENVKTYFRDLMFSTKNIVIPYRLGKLIQKSLIH